MTKFSFHIEHRDGNARSGRICTPHGDIHTPAFIPVGTKATVKSVLPESLVQLQTQAVLANTYHLYLQPHDYVVKKAGGLHSFMNWNKPIFTDSGGFQAFSLGVALGKNITKLVQGQELLLPELSESNTAKSRSETAVVKPASVEENGVLFYSHLDGSKHFFTPTRSMEIQYNLGADIMFAFDECTSPTESKHYQQRALDRTHRWAHECLQYHKEHDDGSRALFAVVQGGQFQDLRTESAQVLGQMDFDGYGIGGSFSKVDMNQAVRWVTAVLPDLKPRHLLGIGEPEDVLLAIKEGCDTFDCVAPTRIARNGQMYTKLGKINVKNSQYREDIKPVESSCECYTCRHYSAAYISHLFHADEMLGATLASIHNLHFIVSLVDGARTSITSGTLNQYCDNFLGHYTNR